MLLAKRDNAYAMYYAKQGLVIGIAWMIVSVVLMVPFLGWAIYAICSVALLIFWVMGMVYSFSGEMKPIPVVGGIAEQINL